jgi:Domain of unknown function (DUF5063)
MKTDKLSTDIQEFLKRTSTETFLLVARQFVELIENLSIEKEKFYSKAHSILLELYSAGQKLEQIELKYSTAESDFDKEVVFENKNVGLISELGKEVFYWEIFDPTYTENENGQPEQGWKITDKEASQGWLVDDFADIYRDIKIELLKIENIGTDEAIEDAFWQLKWGFANHWGRHSINALRYLHYLYYDGKQSL